MRSNERRKRELGEMENCAKILSTNKMKLQMNSQTPACVGNGLRERRATEEKKKIFLSKSFNLIMGFAYQGGDKKNNSVP